MALPRPTSTTGGDAAADALGTTAILGPIRPAELDHTGALLWEELMRCLSLAAYEHITRLGFTPDFVRQNGANRMSAEIWVERHVEAAAGLGLRAETRLIAVGRKNFSTEHRIKTEGGLILASIRQTLVVVDLTTRRAVEAPEFLRAAIG